MHLNSIGYITSWKPLINNSYHEISGHYLFTRGLSRECVANLKGSEGFILNPSDPFKLLSVLRKYQNGKMFHNGI
jgi:hypothetical protein